LSAPATQRRSSANLSAASTARSLTGLKLQTCDLSSASGTVVSASGLATQRAGSPSSGQLSALTRAAASAKPYASGWSRYPLFVGRFHRLLAQRPYELLAGAADEGRPALPAGLSQAVHFGHEAAAGAACPAALA